MLTGALAQCEDDEQMPSGAVHADGQQPLLCLCRFRHRKDGQAGREQFLDFVAGNAMLAAFRPVAIVQSKPDTSIPLYKFRLVCTNVNI